MKAYNRTIFISGLASGLALCVVLLFLPENTLNAQGRGGDALLHDYTERPQWVGGGLGYGYWKSDADFGVTDHSLPCALFSDGDGSGFVLELKTIMYPFQNTWFIVSPRIRYAARAGTFITPLAREPVKGENNETVLLEQEAQVDATLGTLSLDLMLGAEFFGTGVYALAGGSGGLLTGGKYDYTERILNPQGFVFAGTGTNEQQLLGGNNFDNFGSFVVDLRGGLGYLHEIGDWWAVNVEAVYSYPVTSVLEEPDMLKQQGVMGTVSLLYNFGD